MAHLNTVNNQEEVTTTAALPLTVKDLLKGNTDNNRGVTVLLLRDRDSTVKVGMDNNLRRKEELMVVRRREGMDSLNSSNRVRTSNNFNSGSRRLISIVVVPSLCCEY